MFDNICKKLLNSQKLKKEHIFVEKCCMIVSESLLIKIWKKFCLLYDTLCAINLNLIKFLGQNST